MSQDWIKTLKGLGDSWITLATSKSADYMSAHMKILKFLVMDEKLKGVALILNRPYTDFIKRLKDSRINPENILFIDCATKLSKGEPERQKNVLFLSGPRNLSEIGVSIDTALDGITSPQKFLFLDSLSTLLIYHASDTITQFIHFLTSKLREESVKGVIILLDKDLEDKIGSVLKQFSDAVIEVE